jgi:hypothetical protein
MTDLMSHLDTHKMRLIISGIHATIPVYRKAREDLIGTSNNRNVLAIHTNVKFNWGPTMQTPGSIVPCIRTGTAS